MAFLVVARGYFRFIPEFLHVRWFITLSYRTSVLHSSVSPRMISYFVYLFLCTSHLSLCVFLRAITEWRSYRMIRSVPLCVSSSNTSFSSLSTWRNGATLKVSLILGSRSAWGSLACNQEKCHRNGETPRTGQKSCNPETRHAAIVTLPILTRLNSPHY